VRDVVERRIAEADAPGLGQELQFEEACRRDVEALGGAGQRRVRA
jgi:hypothetical protein